MRTESKRTVKIHQIRSSRVGGLLLSFLSLLFFTPSHATTITWEDRGGEAIRLGAVTATASTPSGTYYSVTGNGVIAESRDGGMTWEPANFSKGKMVEKQNGGSYFKSGQDAVQILDFLREKGSEQIRNEYGK